MHSRFKRFSPLDIAAASYIVCYFIVGLCTISVFPLVALDEPWIGETSLNLLKSGTISTSSFPYYVNDLSIFGNPLVLLNAFSIWIFGFNIFALRFFSLFLFICSSALLYLTLKKLFSQKVGLTLVILFSLHPFAINVSRLARSESIIVFFILFGIYLFYHYSLKEGSSSLADRPVKAILIGFVFSIAFLCHTPGMMSILVGLFLVCFYYFPKSVNNIKILLYFIAGTIPSGVIFLYNMYFNWVFYSVHGKRLGTFSFDLPAKLQKYVSWVVQGYDLSLFNYAYLYALLFIVLLAIYGFSRIPTAQRKSALSLLGVFLTINIFLFFFSNHTRFYLPYILLPTLLVLAIPLYYADNRRVIFWVFSTLTGVFFIFQSVLWISYFSDASYKEFDRELKSAIPPGSTVLATIHYRLSFSDATFYAFQDISIAMADGKIGTLEEYMDMFNIEYIVFPYSWHAQSLKGNMRGHGTPYEETMRFLDQRAEPVALFYDKFYSNRYTSWSGLPFKNMVGTAMENKLKDEKYWTKVYRIKRSILPIATSPARLSLSHGLPPDI